MGDVIQFHPAADIFPMMDSAAIRDLADDIKENGLQLPIIRHPDGRILDGRNRYKACEMVGVTPKFETWEGGGSVFSYVVSLNLKRRHLSESQRGIAAAKIATLKRGKRDLQVKNTNTSIDVFEIPTQKEAAVMLNVSVPTVQRAAAVLRKANPSVIQAVESGTMKVSKAFEECTKPKAERRVIEYRGTYKDADQMTTTVQKISALLDSIYTLKPQANRAIRVLESVRDISRKLTMLVNRLEKELR